MEALSTRSEVVDGLGPADYARLAALLNGIVGIKLPPSKRLMLEGRLRGRMRQLGFTSHSAYCDHVFNQGGQQEELPHLIDAVTTNKTDFFREVEHYRFLHDTIVAELLRLRSRERHPEIKFWSVASSTGAELWSAAMVLDQLAADTGQFDYALLGTDISTRVLEHAVRAVYAADLVQPVPKAMREKYLLVPLKAGHHPTVRIVPELRQRASFARLNLMDENYAVDDDQDVCFLRNVLIYFEKSDQEAVVRKVLGRMRKGGFLVLGHSEAPVGSGMGLRQVAPAVFVKET